ncbi:MAG: (2Fe-2S)-binding protein [Limnohabitans sp.]|jgi:isoquinoline 1-oxidoreductase alpha subunit
MASTYNLIVNGVSKSVTVSSSSMPLLWVLRDILGLTGTKYGCGIEVCGACTVLVNGQREHSCVVDISSVAGKSVLTVEGLANDAVGQKVQKAWTDNQVPQCGYCQPGMMMACTGSIKAGHHGNEIASDLKHICMCGTYSRIRTSIQSL